MRKSSNAVYGLTAPDLIAMREKVGMRPSQLADAMGLSRALVCLWEQGKNVIDDQHVPAIREAIESYVPPPPDRWFWKHVAIGGDDECWEWQSYIRPAGYGQLTRHGRVRQAHRTSWELANGPIPDGKIICHHCDNPPCVNPAHLFLGTDLDNVRDMHAKGRQRIHWQQWPPQGVLNGNAKLTDELVLQMRAEYATGAWSQKDLAERYGVSKALVSFVVSGRVWKHVTHGQHCRSAA